MLKKYQEAVHLKVAKVIYSVYKCFRFTVTVGSDERNI